MDSRHQIVVAFKAPPDLVERIDAIAKAEGASRAGVARRLIMRSEELARGREESAA